MNASSSTRRSVAGSTVLVMAASVFSAILGFGREVVTAHYYGTRAEMDAFINASTIPTLLVGVLNSALISALVPTFAEFMSAGKVDEVKRLGSTVINVLLLVMTALAVLGWILAPLYVPFVAHGFPPQEQSLVVRMVRWQMPGIVAASLGGVCAAILNAYHRFLAASLVWVATNVVTIVFVIILHRELGIFALVLGSVIGFFAQLIVQMPQIVRDKLYRFKIDLGQPAVLKTWSLFLPVILASSAVQLNLACDKYFASTLTTGSTAGIGYTTKLAWLPVPIIAGAIITVIFPLIARQFASADREGARRSITTGLQMVSFIVIPCAAGLSVLAFPIVQTLFERGAFTASATAFCASLIPFACIPLVAVSYNTVLGRACYACKDVKAAVTGSVLAVMINISLSASFLPYLGARGLLLANGMAATFLAFYLLVVLWRLIGGFDWKAMLASLTRVGLAATSMSVILIFAQRLFPEPGPFLVARSIHLAVLMAIGAIVYVMSSRLFGVTELAIALNLFRRRLSRGSAVPNSLADNLAS